MDVILDQFANFSRVIIIGSILCAYWNPCHGSVLHFTHLLLTCVSELITIVSNIYVAIIQFIILWGDRGNKVYMVLFVTIVFFFRLFNCIINCEECISMSCEIYPKRNILTLKALRKFGHLYVLTIHEIFPVRKSCTYRVYRPSEQPPREIFF